MSLIVQHSGNQTIDFQLGDRVVYNSNTENLPSAEERPHDHGTVIAIDENYITVKFDHTNYIAQLLPWGVSKLLVATG